MELGVRLVGSILYIPIMNAEICLHMFLELGFFCVNRSVGEFLLCCFDGYHLVDLDTARGMLGSHHFCFSVSFLLHFFEQECIIPICQ